MRVAVYPYIGQIDKRRVAAAAVHRVDPGLSKIQAHPPVVQSPDRRLLCRDIAAVQHQHGNAGQLHEVVHRNAYTSRREGARRLLYRRNLPFGKEKRPRFEGDNSFNIIALYGRTPPRPASLRMGNKHAVAGFVKHSFHGVADNGFVIGSRIGRHLPEKLIPPRRIIPDLDIVKFLRPLANTEIVVPQLVVRHSADSLRLRRPAGSAAPRLVCNICLIAFF